ncbi:MAG: Holliday junction resolvase RuvX [Prevotellaceae bacterium]|jgi:putative Holliday junction resolvase|nr:Holliday junction resolvase RuvX [Prevotellaceae bacterium]
MARIVAIDYGQKRTGLAVTDPLQLIATPLATVATAELLKYLGGYSEKETIACFVVGYPKNMDNTPSEAMRYINPFVERLRQRFPNIPVMQEDERFTSKMALRAMIDGGMKKMDRRDKGMIDRVSAVIILQAYMDRIKG